MFKMALDKTKYQLLGPLLSQLRFSSPETLLEQSYRAERLIQLLDENKQYPYDFICYKITEFKPKPTKYPDLLNGEKLIADLAMFIEQVTRQSPITIDKLPEPFHTAQALANDNDISTKTLKRWMKLGLANRIVIFPDKSQQHVILESTWQWFMKQHESRVSRAVAFSRLSVSQRQTIAREAHKLSKNDNLSRNQIEITLAEKTGRARETIRYILNAYDRQAPAAKRIFPAKIKLTDELRQEIFEMFSKGVAVDKLSHIFGRSGSTIYRIIHEIRQNHWQSVEIDYMYSPEFDLPSAGETILACAQTPIHSKPGTENHIEPFTKNEEQGLFRAYNYLKWKQCQKRKFYVEHKKSTIPSAIMEKLESLQDQINKIQSKLILANQALVVSIAKKHLGGALSLDELISEGLTPLMKSIEKFNYSKGFKFSTYASWAVMKHFARIVPLASAQQQQYIGDENLAQLIPGITASDEERAYERSVAVVRAMEKLNDRERQILENRYSIDRDQDPMSLAELGVKLGVTKERIRQIESRAMDKLYEELKELPSTDDYA